MMEAGCRLFEAQALEERLEASTRNVERLENEVADTRITSRKPERVSMRRSGSSKRSPSKRARWRASSKRFAQGSPFTKSRHLAEPDAGALSKKIPEREPAPRQSPAMAGGWDDWANQAASSFLSR